MGPGFKPRGGPDAHRFAQDVRRNRLRPSLHTREVTGRAVAKPLQLRKRVTKFIYTLAHDRAEPDGRLRADQHVADDDGGLGDVGCRVNLRVLAAKRSDHFAPP